MNHLQSFEEYKKVKLNEGFFSKKEKFNNIHEFTKEWFTTLDNNVKKWFDTVFDSNLPTKIGTHGLKLSYGQILDEMDDIAEHGKTDYQYLPIIKILNGDILCIDLDDKKFPVNIFSHEDDFSKNKKIYNSVFFINKNTKIDSSVSYY